MWLNKFFSSGSWVNHSVKHREVRARLDTSHVSLHPSLPLSPSLPSSVSLFLSLSQLTATLNTFDTLHYLLVFAACDVIDGRLCDVTAVVSTWHRWDWWLVRWDKCVTCAVARLIAFTTVMTTTQQSVIEVDDNHRTCILVTYIRSNFSLYVMHPVELFMRLDVFRAPGPIWNLSFVYDSWKCKSRKNWKRSIFQIELTAKKIWSSEIDENEIKCCKSLGLNT